MLVAYKISFGEKNYKYFIGYWYNCNQVKPLHIMVSKTGSYLRSYDGQTKWMYFLVKVVTYLKNIILFGINSAMI